MTMVRSLRRLLELYERDSSITIVEDRPDDEDEDATKIVRMFQPAILINNTPQKVIGDGNCLYRAASLGLYGSQEHHVNLRLATAMELIEYQPSYDSSSKDQAEKPCCNPILIVSDYPQLLNAALHRRQHQERRAS